MPELTREEKLKLLEKLSPRLQELMTSEDTGAALLYLGQKYHLSDHQVRLLSKVLGDVVLGITPTTNLSSEISTKAAVDMQTASGLAQDLNDLIISPKPAAAVPTPAPIAPAPLPTLPMRPPVAPITPSTPVVPHPIITPSMPKLETPALPPVNIGADRYREQISGGPEIIDLRKTPPPPIQIPVAAAPIPPSPLRSPALRGEGGLSPQPVISPIMPSATPRPISPLTFTKPVEKPLEPVSMPHLIEADPHKTPTLTPTLRPPVSEVGAPTPAERGVGVEADPHKILPPTPTPQYIIRPPGLAPTDMPRDVLDLRKDKGEF